MIEKCYNDIIRTQLRLNINKSYKIKWKINKYTKVIPRYNNIINKASFIYHKSYQNFRVLTKLYISGGIHWSRYKFVFDVDKRIKK